MASTVHPSTRPALPASPDEHTATEAEHSKAGVVARATARGVVAAMAMTGMRTVFAAVDRRDQAPPEAIVSKLAPSFARIVLPRRQRKAFTELVHWGYGGLGGAVFGALPDPVRRHPAAGPIYGTAVWLGFELVMAPLLGIRPAKERKVLWRALIAADHLLYGIVVGGRLAPEPLRRPGR